MSGLGDAEGEGVGGPVPEAGDQLPERRASSCPKGTIVFFPPELSGVLRTLRDVNSLHLSCLTLCLQDKKYATDKYKDIYTELSIVKAKAERDLGRLRDQLQLAHEALGEPSQEEVERGGYGRRKQRGCRRLLSWCQEGLELLGRAGSVMESPGLSFNPQEAKAPHLLILCSSKMCRNAECLFIDSGDILSLFLPDILSSYLAQLFPFVPFMKICFHASTFLCTLFCF